MTAMTTASDVLPAPPSRGDTLGQWWPVGLGLLAVVLPTYVRLHEGLWNQEAYEHGPIIAAIFWWLMWRHRDRVLSLPAAGMPITGAVVLGVGLLTYFVGRSQDLALFEVGAQLPIFAGVLLVLRGIAALRAMWFPLLFLLFLVPLPGFVIVAVTGELKQYVSWVAETILYHVGYPIARDGVVITIGQYRMLVADACSGLNSMYSLTAMGLLYLHLMQRPQWWRNALLLLAILPIAFVANVVRVIILILLTYHFGDAAGQGFLHGASGIVLFVIALLTLFAADGGLGLVARLTRGRGQAREVRS